MMLAKRIVKEVDTLHEIETYTGLLGGPGELGHGRLSSVHYVRFDTTGRVPVALGSDHPELVAETRLTDEQRRALASSRIMRGRAGEDGRIPAATGR